MASMDEEEEGAVMYAVEKNKKGNRTVLVLWKIKTLEYRLFRKMREKLKQLVVKRNKAQLVKRFATESKQLIVDFAANRALDYYIELFDVACEFIVNKGIGSSVVSNQYVDFLKVVRTCHSKEIEPTFKMLRE